MKLLIIEDDELILQSIKNSLESNYQVDASYNGEEGLYMARQNIYDAIILDIMIPLLDGYEVLKILRKENIDTPVLFLTAKDSLEDKIKGLKIGADDYIVKPFHIQELKARIEALLRRSGSMAAENILKYKEIELNIKNRELSIKGEKINLQVKLFDLLEYLINNKETILTKEQIFDRVWGFESDTTINIVEVYMHKLRKILSNYNYDKCIKTIRGVGYMLKTYEDENV